MTEVSKEKDIDIKRGVKIAFKTIADCFIVIMFIMCSLFVVFPKFSLKIHQMLGMERMQGLNYRVIYGRSGNIADLYNLIIFEGNQKDYKEELAYIDEMIERKDYNSFCESMDKASLVKISSNQLNPYSANVNGYLLSRKIICMYELEQEGMDAYVYRKTNTGKLSEYSFSTYVDLIYFDEELSVNEKKENFSKLLQISDVIEGNLITLEQLVQKRVDSLKHAISLELDDNKKDVLGYTLMRIYASRYYIYDVLGEENLKNENLELYREIKIELAK